MKDRDASEGLWSSSGPLGEARSELRHLAIRGKLSS